MARMQVVLDSVLCKDTEDTGAFGINAKDEFYLVGTVSDGEQTSCVLTVPISIAKGQTKGFDNGGGGVVFDFAVPDGRQLKVALIAFDEDLNKDWARQGETIQMIADIVSAGLKQIPSPYTTAASTLLPYVVKAVGGLLTLDKDDKLGEYGQEFPSESVPVGEHFQAWNFNGEIVAGWSDWEYTVQYRVIKF